MRMAHMRGSPARLLVLATLVSLGAGCAMNKTEKGAIIGAGAGGAAGAVIGNATGAAVRGAIIGATVGGVAGAVIGHQMDQQAEELAYELPGATVQRVGQGPPGQSPQSPVVRAPRGDGAARRTGDCGDVPGGPAVRV